MLFIISVLTCLALFYLFQFWSRKERKIPSGLKPLPHIKGLPIIGIIHQLKPTTCILLNKLGKIYGPIFQVNLGMRPVIVINDFKTMSKAFRENGDNFTGRPQFEGMKVLTHRSGIAFEDGEMWVKQRSFILKVFRDFGLGKSKSANIVERECSHLMDELKSLEGKLVDFSTIIPIYTANIISTFIMSKRYAREDPKLKVIDDMVKSLAHRQNPVIFLHLLFPILDGIGWLMKHTEMKMYIPVYKMFDEEIQEHKKNLDFSSEGDNVMDRFLIEQKRMEDKTGSVETFTNWQLIRIGVEFFAAGYEATSTILTWSLMFMSRYPHIQNLVYQEITDQIREERLPNINDRKSLNYTLAVLDEVMRMASAAPLALQHRVIKDCEISGYFIPRDSMVIPNIYACNFDENIWEKPYEFIPERFLHKDERGLWKYNAREEFIPFGLGKRQCLGESLARIEYFLFFTNIIRMFHVRFSKELSDEQYEKVLISNEGLIRTCRETNFIFELRSRN